MLDIISIIKSKTSQVQVIQGFWRLLRAVKSCDALFVLIFLGLVSTKVPAQSVASEKFVTRTWTHSEGLPDNSVTAVLQARDGYLWVGTQSGLARFDGVSFKPVALGTATNSDAWITDMCEDPQGRIWIGTEQLGLFCYSNTVVRQVGAGGEITRPITTLALGDGTDLWIGTRQGLGLWSGKKIRWFTVKDGLPEEAISSVCVARAGKVWITAHSGVYLYQNGQLGKYHFSTESQGRSPEFLGIFEDRQRELWAFGDTYLIKLGEGRRFNYFRNGQISSARIWSFHEARDGRLWIGTSGKGLFQFTGEGFRPVVFQNGTVASDVRAIYQDRERNVWLGTDGGGLVQLREEHLRQLGALEGLPGARATGIAQSRSNHILISYLGEGTFAGDGEHFLPFGPAELANALHFVHTLCAASNGDVWFGSASVGLLCLHGGRVVNFDAANGLAGQVVTYLQASTNGSVWAGTLAGQIYQCGEADLQPAGSVRAAVTAMLSAASNHLYAGTAAGSVWEMRGDRFVPLVARKATGASAITSMCEDAKGRVWIGTLTNGLHCLHNQVVTSWPAVGSLAELRVHGLITDLDGNLWLMTSSGLAVMETTELDKALESGEFSELRIIEHLNVSEAGISGGPNSLRANDGSLWFILQGRVIQVDPKSWRSPRTIPPVYIESVRVNNMALKNLAVTAGAIEPVAKTLPRLPANVRAIDIEFTTPCLTAPERTRFRYKLEGFDADWIKGNPLERRVRYGVIPAGQYRFIVTAANAEGTWNKEGAAFAFIVPVPLLRQPWVLALALLALAGLVAWVARYVSHRRLRRRLSRLERSEEMSRERMRIAQDMHDEIGSKLARISFLSEGVKAELKGFYQQTDVVDSLAKTARDLLQSLDRMVWAVNPRNDTLEHLASYLNRHASEFFHSTPIQCELAIPGNLPALPLSAEIRHNIFLAFEEALTNVMKHSGATRVNVELKFEPGRLQISIADNGSGFEFSGRPESGAERAAYDRLGLSGLRRRLESIGGECQIETSPGNGTVVKFNLPFQQKYAR